MLQAFKAPEHTGKVVGSTIFLAGTIDNGEAEDWQEYFTRKMTSASVIQDVQIFNPRREDWDPTWDASMEQPEFVEQVDWEFEHMEISDVIAMYFVPGSKSPITLLELGLTAADTPYKLIVCCPHGFWRKGNVDFVCKRYLIHTVDSLDELIAATKRKIKIENIPR